MDEKRRRVVNAICLVLIVMLSVIFGVLAYSLRKKEKWERERLQQIAAQVQPKESELRDLQEELEEKEKQISYVSDMTRIMVGFVISQQNDIDDILELSAEYGFSPVLVLNCAMDAETLSDQIRLAAETDWEIMLTASPFYEEIGETIDVARTGLESAGLQDSGVFLLRDDDYGTKNTEILREKGFVGYTRYHEEIPMDGYTDDAAVYFDYSYIQAVGTSVGSRFAALYNNKASLILVFDMDAVERGALPKEEITNILDLSRKYADQDDCTYATIEEVVEYLFETGSIKSELRNEYDQYAADHQGLEEELQKSIEEIYEGNQQITSESSR